MKKLFGRIKDFVKAHKDEQGFRYTVIIVVLIIAAIAASEWRKWQDSREFPPQTEIVEEVPDEKEEPDIIQKIWDDSKFHFIIFSGLTITLFIVKCRNETKLQESGGKIKK